MRREIIELQDRAVCSILSAIEQKTEVVFRAPTGSGKTYMMADFMNRILAANPDVVFLVSSLSKGGLAEQNYERFLEYANTHLFSNIDPYLINTDESSEASIYIPLEYNVYVLPRDLYGENRKIKKTGAFSRFLMDMEVEKHKEIWLIKDECHEATNNLDSERVYFKKILNLSATPFGNKKKHPKADVEISDYDAEMAGLIKHVQYSDEEGIDALDKALNRYRDMRTAYRKELFINPCLIIQVSNKGKVERELEMLFSLLRSKHDDLKWMYIVQGNNSDTNDRGLKKLPVSEWRKEAKRNTSSIDVIIFKLTISVGWDIPRACMLYQIRDTQSETLSEQVIGRIRRNPRLTDFEALSEEQQGLCLKAYVWGKPDKLQKVNYEVRSVEPASDELRLMRTKLDIPEGGGKKGAFDIEAFMSGIKENEVHENIFKLYRDLNGCHYDLRQLGKQYIDTPAKWFKFTENIVPLRKEYNKQIGDYSKSMYIDCDSDGNPLVFGLPVQSYYEDMENPKMMVKELDWLWERVDGKDDFAFDSEAETRFAEILAKMSWRDRAIKEVDDHFVWAKNLLYGSEIHYEYYNDGLLKSYPDFVMKDSFDRVHIIEVKSYNSSSNAGINEEEYKDKIEALKPGYQEASRLLEYYFYIAILKGNDWTMHWFHEGKHDTITLDEWKKIVKTYEETTYK